MLGKTTPYQPTAGTNLNHAELISIKIVAQMIKRSKNPILIVGDKGEGIEHLENLNIKKIHVPKDMNLLDAMKMISKEDYDLALFSGITYYYLAQALTHLKHFSDIVTITIDRYYHPNAKYSFPNMETVEYIEAVKRLVILCNNP